MFRIVFFIFLVVVRDKRALFVHCFPTFGKHAFAFGGEGFIWPTPGFYTITSPFGYRVHPITGLWRFHGGIDIGAPLGAQTLAVADGTVLIAGWDNSYGNYIILDHGGGVHTLYAHLSQMHVSTGQTIRQGEVIGLVGSTGNSTGPHLHFEVRINGELADPKPHLDR